MGPPRGIWVKAGGRERWMIQDEDAAAVVVVGERVSCRVEEGELCN